MYVELIRDYCISKKDVTESFPFNENVLVFKIKNKIFALIDLAHPDSINLKCDPERAIEMREKHPEVIPGFHMNKKHWNTVMLNGMLDEKMIIELIDHSFDMVIKNLSKKEKVDLR